MNVFGDMVANIFGHSDQLIKILSLDKITKDRFENIVEEIQIRYTPPINHPHSWFFDLDYNILYLDFRTITNTTSAPILRNGCTLIAHEITHVEQKLSGKLKSDGEGGVYWDGQLYSMLEIPVMTEDNVLEVSQAIEDYINQPWEEEAMYQEYLIRRRFGFGSAMEGRVDTFDKFKDLMVGAGILERW